MSQEDTIKEIIGDRAGLNIERVTRESRLEDGLDMDSLDRIEMVMEIEEALGIEIPDAEADKFLTVQDVIDYCKEKTQN